MEKKRALYAGTFDPFTNGHLDIVQRAITIFDEVVILVAVSPNKKPFLSTEQRVNVLRKLFGHEPKVKVESWKGLIVEYARLNKITSIVRGLRPTGDFEIEFQMASMNRKINPDCDTVFLMTSEKLYYISSSLVKEVFMHNGDVTPFVPPLVHEELKKITIE
ncbi:MAG TPA: pantetheine-phosphate adenylyltransferase [Bacteriovoracaceae bacterium]|nr:pantetheine-phosphate adenylyltransferase [Bacteriovoracaceae bacterium]